MAAARPAGPPPTTATSKATTSKAADASFIPSHLTLSAAFSSRHFQAMEGFKCFDRFARRNAASGPMARICKSWRFLIALRSHESGYGSGFFASDAGDPRCRILRAYLHGARSGLGLNRHARGRARALGRDVCLARGGARRRCDRWSDRAAARRRARAAELVGRGARSGCRFRHLRLCAGLCDHCQWPIAAGGGAAARHRHRRVGRALFRRPPHEDRGQPFSRLSGPVECRRVLPVSASSGAGTWQPRDRHPYRADVCAPTFRSSGPREAPALAHPDAGLALGSTCDLRAVEGFRRRRARHDSVVRDRPLCRGWRCREPAREVAQGMIALLTSAEAWAALLTLTALEIVLGIDNVIFLSVIVSRIPQPQARRARQIGLALALLFRILLLSLLVWLIGLTQAVLTVKGMAFSWRDIILIGGGLFLIAKATHEIHAEVEAGDEEGQPTSGAGAFLWVIAQIIVIDMVFSLDSIITAIGMARGLTIMIAAVVIACLIMYVSSGPIAKFVSEHPTTKMLALAFLVLIGVALVADGFQFHIPRGYIYFAITFSAAVEFFNVLAKRNRKKAPN